MCDTASARFQLLVQLIKRCFLALLPGGRGGHSSGFLVLGYRACLSGWALLLFAVAPGLVPGLAAVPDRD